TIRCLLCQDEFDIKTACNRQELWRRITGICIEALKVAVKNGDLREYLFVGDVGARPHRFTVVDDMNHNRNTIGYGLAPLRVHPDPAFGHTSLQPLFKAGLVLPDDVALLELFGIGNVSAAFLRLGVLKSGDEKSEGERHEKGPEGT